MRVFHKKARHSKGQGGEESERSFGSAPHRMTGFAAYGGFRLSRCCYMASISLILYSFPVMRKVLPLWQYGHSLPYCMVG